MFESAHDWLGQTVRKMINAGDANGLGNMFLCVMDKLDGEDIQDIFQSEMSEDGFFKSKYVVRLRAHYNAQVDHKKDAVFSDEICDIVIPETPAIQYKEDTTEVIKVIDKSGQVIAEDDIPEDLPPGRYTVRIQADFTTTVFADGQEDAMEECEEIEMPNSIAVELDDEGFEVVSAKGVG